MSSKRPWTDKSLAGLRELALNHTRQQIADILGRSYHSINAACLRYGIKPVSEEGDYHKKAENEKFVYKPGKFKPDYKNEIAVRVKKGEIIW